MDKKRGRPSILSEQTVALGQRIKSLRIERGLTQSELGDRIGVKQERISKIEMGTAAVDIFTGVAIVNALETTHAFLLESTEVK